MAALICAASLFNARAADEQHGQLSSKDYKFVSAATQGGNMEVTLGQIAVQKASEQSIREFGQRMVTDHTKANIELKELISQKGATLPDLSSKMDDMTRDHLNGLSGKDFDKAYIKQMVKDHKKDVKEFQKQADKGDDADLKAWVTKTLPILQEHLRLAENIETSLNGAVSQASK